jgi:hypothetical protein
MAKKEEHAAEPKDKGKKPKKHLHQIVTTFAHDGTAGHEHVYKDKKEDHHSHPPVFAGTSSNMEDLHAHMDDNAGPVMQGGAAGGGAPEEQPEAGVEPAAEPGV